MKKKIYISIPITGKDLLHVRAETSVIEAELTLKGWKVVTPFDICSEPDKSYSYYMGKDIEGLLDCDAVYFCKGWQNSKGCNAEFEIAKIYNKQILFDRCVSHE
jgi:hypothetical protein